MSGLENVSEDVLEEDDPFAFDLALENHDVDSELRRVSSSYGLEKGDLKTVRTSGDYVLSSCIDCWSVVANKDLSMKNQRDVIILTMPTSSDIYNPFGTGIEEPPDLQGLAQKWKPWRTEFLKYLLMPVNLQNKHWCLLIVDLEQKKVTCWDSLSTFNKGKIVNSKKGRDNLYRFLQYWANDKEDTWKGNIDLENVPQQTITDCGIFCIEFMRAFIKGHRTVNSLYGQVSQKTMLAAREHIAREIKEKKIIEEGKGMRERKKSRRADDN